MKSQTLNLRVGELIEVKSHEEILATLDQNGSLEGLPFMPEMLEYCGKRFRVRKRADKTCDNIQEWSMRRLKASVHLEELRCSGSAHGECEAGCLIFWKEAWLKRAVGEKLVNVPERLNANPPSVLCTLETLRRCAVTSSTASTQEEIYSCQATELRNFTSDLRWWDLRQYVRDIKSGNLFTGIAGDSRSERFLEIILSVLQMLRCLLISLYNKIQRPRHGMPFPRIEGRLVKTPAAALNLQRGELVQIKSKEEILETLDSSNKNRGLLFDSEMLRYCGGIYRVLRSVHQIIDEKTGRMMRMKNPCIILEGVACQADYHQYCSRSIYHYWRENWLRRAAGEEGLRAPTKEQIREETCSKCAG